MFWMRNEQFGALLIQLQSIQLSVRGSLSVSARLSSSLDQVHRYIQRRGLIVWPPMDRNYRSAFWSPVKELQNTVFAMFVWEFEISKKTCFKFSDWKCLKYVCAPLTGFLYDCLLFMYLAF
jgi:hypothetical protein